MRSTFAKEQGAVAVIVAAFLVGLFGFAALAFDVGYWYSVERQLQSAADAAALAGCQVIARNGAEAAAWDEIEKYVTDNQRGLLETATIDPSRSYVDTSARRVKVTLTTESRAWFARVLGTDSALIPAQSVAKVGYLAGARNPVPWGLPILHASRVTARTGGSGEVALDADPDNARIWEGNLPSGAFGDVTVTMYNEQTLDPNYPDGVPEAVSGVARIVQLPVGSPISDVRLDKQMYTVGSGDEVEVAVDLVAPLPAGQGIAAVLDRQTANLTAVTPTSYTGTLPVPYTDDLYESFTLSVAIKQGGRDVFVLDPAARLVSRRSTFPVKNVEIEPTCYPAGSSGAPAITVEFNDYEYAKLYELKVVGGGGEVGNFMALDFATLRHPSAASNWWTQQAPVEYPDMPGGTSTNYYPYIAGTASYPFVMHLGDAVWTQTGSLSFPTTRDALDTRFAGETADWDGWVADGKLGTSKRLVYIPIVEKIQEVTGNTAVRIVSFGLFYVEDFDHQGGNAVIYGRFVKEVPAPSWVVVDDPPGGIAIPVAHLVKEDLEF